ncbi:peroxiredoxin [Alphaproteobacteria bacterium]|nr:peroxiredoxin [Alphaproteobacteria bacterium]
MSDNLNTSIPENEGDMNILKNKSFPNISLPNQDGQSLNLHRPDTFRMVLYFYPMTGRLDRPLPDNWNNIPGAKGCTFQTCSFRDNYDEIISLNAVPIGISSQSVDDNKEMTSRLKVPYDVLSDEKLELSKELNIPTFSVNSKFFLKRITLVVEKKIIKKVFYPINDINKHIEEVLKWLKAN